MQLPQPMKQTEMTEGLEKHAQEITHFSEFKNHFTSTDNGTRQVWHCEVHAGWIPLINFQPFIRMNHTIHVDMVNIFAVVVVVFASAVGVCIF